METNPHDQDAPSVLGSYAHGWDILKAHFGRLLLALFLFLILQLPGSMDVGDGGLLSSLYQLLVVGPLSFGISYTFLVAVRGRAPEVSDLFAPFQRAYVSAIAVSLLLPIVIVVSALPLIGAIMLASLGDGVGVLLAGASLLIVLPIYATVRLSFIPYLLVDEGLGPIEVLGESWARTRPVQLQILGIEALSAVVLLAGLLLLVIGVFPAMILAGLALATLYDDVSPLGPEEEDEPAFSQPTAP